MSQLKQIRHHLESGKSITPLQAQRLYGCMRLAARIHDLKAKGIAVISKPLHVGTAVVAKYSLVLS